MKCRRIFVAAGMAIAAVLLAPSAPAQEWSREQQEVWEFIVTCNEHFVSGDETAILECYHDDFSGWRYGETVPRNKQSVAEFLPVDLAGESLASDLRPISIRVFGNFAIAHYFLVEASRDTSGEVVRQKMIWTDIMLKEGGRWRWVADHGGTLD